MKLDSNIQLVRGWIHPSGQLYNMTSNAVQTEWPSGSWSPLLQTLPPTCFFCQAALRRVLNVSNFFLFVAFPRPISWQKLLTLSSLCRQFLLPRGLVFALIYIDDYQTLYRHWCVGFQIRSNHLDWPNVDSIKGLERTERWSREIWGTWAYFQVS